MPELSAIDWIVLAVLTLSLLLGLWRGIAREVLSLIGWVAAFWLAQMHAPRMAQWLPMSGSSEMLRYAAGFVVTFLAVLIVSALAGWLMRQFLSAVGLGWLDRLLGGVFGLLRGGVVLLAGTVVVNMTPLAPSPMWTQSHAGPVLTQGLHAIKPLLPSEFGKFLP
jgi:membrane protein required for colicin V production